MSRMIAMLALLLGACGYKAEIESLQAELQAARDTLAQRDGTIGALEAEVSRLGGRIADLEAALTTKEADLAALEAELDVEREKSSRILADRGALRDEIAQMKAALEDLAERKRQAEARVQEFRDLVARFKALIDAGTLDVAIVDGRMVVRLKTDILFASGSADLSDDGRDALGQVAAVLADLRDRKYQVEGHTDDVPIKTQRFPSNWFLAAARAIGVVQHLIDSGLPADRVSAASFGETHPVAANDTPENKALNRRIEIVVVPDLSELPGYDELTAL